MGRLCSMPSVMGPVLKFAQEHLGIGVGSGCGEPLTPPSICNGRHRDRSSLGEPIFQIGVLRVTLCEAGPDVKSRSSSSL
jgi:hypothetical protein